MTLKGQYCVLSVHSTSVVADPYQDVYKRQVPDYYIRKQTLANAERYITPELKELESKIVGAEERLLKLEREIFASVREEVGKFIPRILASARAAAEIDMCAGFAEVAVSSKMCIRDRRMSTLAPYLFVQIEEKIDRARAEGHDVISLGIGDPDMPTPDHIVEVAKDSVAKPANHQYPSSRGMKSFRQSVAKYYERNYGVKLDADTEIGALIGSKEGIGPVSYTHLVSMRSIRKSMHKRQTANTLCNFVCTNWKRGLINLSLYQFPIPK